MKELKRISIVFLAFMVLFSAVPSAAEQAAEAGAETVITVSNDSYVLFEEGVSGGVLYNGYEYPVNTEFTITSNAAEVTNVEISIRCNMNLRFKDCLISGGGNVYNSGYDVNLTLEGENSVINSTGCAFYVPVDTTLTVGGSGIMTLKGYTALGNSGRDGGKLVLNSGTLYCLEFSGNVPSNVNTEVEYNGGSIYIYSSAADGLVALPKSTERLSKVILDFSNMSQYVENNVTVINGAPVTLVNNTAYLWGPVGENGSACAYSIAHPRVLSTEAQPSDYCFFNAVYTGGAEYIVNADTDVLMLDGKQTGENSAEISYSLGAGVTAASLEYTSGGVSKTETIELSAARSGSFTLENLEPGKACTYALKYTSGGAEKTTGFKQIYMPLLYSVSVSEGNYSVFGEQAYGKYLENSEVKLSAELKDGMFLRGWRCGGELCTSWQDYKCRLTADSVFEPQYTDMSGIVKSNDINVKYKAVADASWNYTADNCFEVTEPLDSNYLDMTATLDGAAEGVMSFELEAENAQVRVEVNETESSKSYVNDFSYSGAYSIPIYPGVNDISVTLNPKGTGSALCRIKNIEFKDGGEKYTIDGVPSDITLGSVSGGRIADAFSKVTLTAKPAEGCVFTGWTDEDGNLVSLESKMVVEAQKNAVYTANFVKSEENLKRYKAITDTDNIVKGITGNWQPINDADTPYIRSEEVGLDETSEFVIDTEVPEGLVYNMTLDFAPLYAGEYDYCCVSVDGKIVSGSGLTEPFEPISVSIGSGKHKIVIMVCSEYEGSGCAVDFKNIVFAKKTGTAQVVPAVGERCPGSGTVSGGGTVNIGDSVTLTAVPSEGCYFMGWMDESEMFLYSVDPKYTFTVAESGNYHAAFGEMPQADEFGVSPEGFVDISNNTYFILNGKLTLVPQQNGYLSLLYGPMNDLQEGDSTEFKVFYGGEEHIYHIKGGYGSELVIPVTAGESVTLSYAGSMGDLSEAIPVVVDRVEYVTDEMMQDRNCYFDCYAEGADVQIGGAGEAYPFGSSVVLTAPKVDGCEFLGFCDEYGNSFDYTYDEALSAYKIELTANKDTYLTAVYCNINEAAAAIYMNDLAKSSVLLKPSSIFVSEEGIQISSSAYLSDKPFTFTVNVPENKVYELNLDTSTYEMSNYNIRIDGIDDIRYDNSE